MLLFTSMQMQKATKASRRSHRGVVWRRSLVGPFYFVRILDLSVELSPSRNGERA